MNCIKCGRNDSEWMGAYDGWINSKTYTQEFTCCLCLAGIIEDSDDAVVLFGTGRGRTIAEKYDKTNFSDST